MPAQYLLAIDQGTTSTRAVVFDETGCALGSSSWELKQYYPQPAWVEHDADEIWKSVEITGSEALEQAKIKSSQLSGIGLTNQRETVVVWERATGKPLARAIVWQDRRTADFCRERRGDEPWLQQRTGLVLDPYFSATKLRWLLEKYSDWRVRAERGELLAGTIDSFLMFRLTGGKSHVTDASNASRTLLLNLQSISWDDELCRYFTIPRMMLPEVRPSAADFGQTRGLGFLPDGLPIAGVAGDQQAALFGQAAFSPGEAKCTYGTGAFLLLHTGERPVMSKHKLLTTVAAMTNAKPQYALEGSVFVAGAAVQWLRDNWKLFTQSSECEALAQRADEGQEVIVVPALVGLGAPHWEPKTRGVIFGLTRNTGAAELVRATLDGVAYQVADLMEAARQDAETPLPELRVDGGMARNDLFLQIQADILGLPVLRSSQSEATALGAAFLAGLRLGVWKSQDEIRQIVAAGRRFAPKWSTDERARRLAQWRRAVKAVIEFYKL
ncbi:MAG TPA: glycerol kinase GlpK [Gemmataceae bacterium]|nr:glycerol kinase GlpK [Gemmataceae bacterium]